MLNTRLIKFALALLLCVAASAQNTVVVIARGSGGGGGGGGSCSDTFDRADSTSLGADWTEEAGDFAIFSNTLRQVNGSYANNLAIFSGTCGSSTTQFIKVQITNDGGDYPGLVFRFTNAASAYYVVYHDANALWDWNYCPSVGGSCSSIGTCDSGTFADGDSYGVTLEGSDTATNIRIWKNPTADEPVSKTEWDMGDTTPDATCSQDPPTPVNSGTKTGLAGAAGSANVIRFNDFKSGDTN